MNRWLLGKGRCARRSWPCRQALLVPAPRSSPSQLAILFLFSLFMASAPTAVAETVVVDGVSYVRNGASPLHGQRSVVLQEQWRAGGEDDDVFFGLIVSAIADEAGNTYLLDRQLAQVYVYSPEGKHLRTLSREGEGPGESRLPIDLVKLPSGDFGIVQSFPGRIVGIKPDGTPTAGVTPGGDSPTEGGFLAITRAACRGGNLVLGGMRMTRQGDSMRRTQFLAACQTNGAMPAIYLEKPSADLMESRKYVEKSEYFGGRSGWAIGYDGRVYVAPEYDRYVIHVFASDGELERAIERSFSPRKRTAQDKQRLTTGVRLRANGRDIPIEGVFDDYDPCVRSVHARQDGSLWVLTSRGERDQPAGTLRTYDVYDAAGNFVEQVALRGSGDDRDGVFWLTDDRLLLVKGLEEAARAFRGEGDPDKSDAGEPEPLSVICYKLSG